mgnify:FL=1
MVQNRVKVTSNMLTRRMSIAFFYIFIFALPLFEAPKNIFGVLFVMFGFVAVCTDRRWTNNQPLILTLFGLLCLILSTVFAGLGQELADRSRRVR